MSDSTRVRCIDCGHEWNSSADNPRCSKADCGRSRRVRPVDELDDAGPADEPDADETAEQADVDDDEPDDAPDDADVDADPGGSEWTPAFQTVEQTVEPPPELGGGDTDELPGLDADEPDDDGGEDDEDDEDDDGADPADAVPEIDPEQLAVAFDLTFDVAARRRGDHWELGDDEAEQLGKAWAPVANTYLPALLAEHTELGIALLATAAIVAPRVAVDRELAEKEDAEDRAEADGEPGDVREPSIVEDDGDEWTPPTDEQTPAEAGGSTEGAYANV